MEQPLLTPPWAAPRLCVSSWRSDSRCRLSLRGCVSSCGSPSQDPAGSPGRALLATCAELAGPRQQGRAGQAGGAVACWHNRRSMSFLVYLGGGALLGALMRWWRPHPGWRWIAGYWLAAGAFFAAPLITSDLQVPSDVAYQWRPWREMVEAPVVPANGLLSDIPLQIIPFRALVRD